ncbi:hypothetical protein CDIK_2698 [Cucumispora dikerogammari]|nr:hypothetical protein CDIK_2698 [Cucumispora dikerogammari]
MKNGDGLRWRCLAKKCAKKYISVRKGSIFEGVRLPLKKIILVLYMWSRDTPIKKTKHKLEVGKDGVNTVLKILRLNLCEKKTKIRGRGCLVEIDETKGKCRKNT